jgi:hypothetical protein
MAAEQADGRCFCGAIRFKVDLPVTVCVHCHCGMCRRMHGAAYVTWIEVPRSQLHIESGEDRLHWLDSSEKGRRSFCTECGTALFCSIHERPKMIDIVLANLETPIGLAPQLHIHWDDRADWTVVSDALPKLGGKTGLEPVAD